MMSSLSIFTFAVSALSVLSKKAYLAQPNVIKIFFSVCGTEDEVQVLMYSRKVLQHRPAPLTRGTTVLPGKCVVCILSCVDSNL